MNSFSFVSDGTEYSIEDKPEYVFHTDIERLFKNEEDSKKIIDGYAYSVCINTIETPDIRIRQLIL